MGFSQDSDPRRWDLYVLLALIYLILDLWLRVLTRHPFCFDIDLKKLRFYLMDLTFCSVWQKSPSKIVTFLKPFTVFIYIIRNFYLVFVFIVWIYWSLWTFCLAVPLGWGNHRMLFLFPGRRSKGYLCIVLKYAFCECLRVPLCNVIFLDDQSGQKQLQKVSGEQSSHLDTYMKYSSCTFKSCERQTTPTWSNGSWWVPTASENLASHGFKRDCLASPAIWFFFWICGVLHKEY